MVNVVASNAAREADGVLYTWAGPEIAVATTKAYSAQLGALYLIAIKAALANNRITEAQAREYCKSIAALPEQIEEVGTDAHAPVNDGISDDPLTTDSATP